MYQVAFVLFEQSGKSRDEALAYWGSTHAGLVRQIPGVREYLQGAQFLGDGAAPFLGIATLSFDDEAAFGVAAGSAEFAAAIADVANFADPARLPTYVLTAPQA